MLRTLLKTDEAGGQLIVVAQFVGDVVGSLFWFALFVAYVAGAIAAIVIVVRANLPVWARVLIVAALLAVGVFLPLLVVTLFWLVYGAILLGKRLTRDATPPPVDQS